MKKELKSPEGTDYNLTKKDGIARVNMFMPTHKPRGGGTRGMKPNKKRKKKEISTIENSQGGRDRPMV